MMHDKQEDDIHLPVEFSALSLHYHQSGQANLSTQISIHPVEILGLNS